MLRDGSPCISDVYDILYRFGITANYIGFFHMSFAVCLAVQQPERLLLVTKWIYPEVARHYNTTWKCVERNIRTVTTIAWNRNRPLMEQLAKRTLPDRPTPAAFLAVLAAVFRDEETA